MRNVRMIIEYDGTDYAGWQKQPGGMNTVQGVLEAALSRIVQEHVLLTAAGRTDRGVHARGQVANFRTESAMSLERLMHAVNGLLPDTVCVRNIREVSDTFHARYSALVREYRYFILEKRSAIDQRYAGYHGFPLDLERLNLCAKEIVGRHDFAVYAKGCSSAENTFCTVYGAAWGRHEDMVVFRISANRFLRTMVRFLVSAQLGAAPGALEETLRTGRLLKSLVPADPAGLFLWQVVY